MQFLCCTEKLGLVTTEKISSWVNCFRCLFFYLFFLF